MPSRRALLAAVLAAPPGTARPVPTPVPRMLARFRLGGHPCAAVAVPARTRAGEAIDLLAVAGAGRLLVLEPWAGVATAVQGGRAGAHLAGHIDLLPAGGGLILRRDAAAPDPIRLRWHRQAWTDVLVWDAASGVLDDHPARPPPSGTWQAVMARRRRAVLARLEATPPAALFDRLPDDLIAAVAVWPWDHDPEDATPDDAIARDAIAGEAIAGEAVADGRP